MSILPDILAGRVQPGLYRFSSHAAPQRIRRDAEKAGWVCFCISGRDVVDKAGFLRAAASAMSFPSGYGRNWDAFDEAVRDLNWARPREAGRGFIVLYDDAGRFASAQPEQFAVARDVLRSAVAAWLAHGVPMFVLLRGANVAAADLRKL